MRKKYHEVLNNYAEKLCESVQPMHLLNAGRVSSLQTPHGNTRYPVFNEEDQAKFHDLIGPQQQLLGLVDTLARKPDAVFDWLLDYLKKQGHYELSNVIANSAENKEFVVQSNVTPLVSEIDSIEFHNIIIDRTNPFSALLMDKQPLAQGSFGTIYRCGARTDPSVECVVKEALIPIKGRARTAVLKLLDREEEVISKLIELAGHPNITKFLFCNRTDYKFSIFMEYLPGGDLQDFIDDKGKQPETIVLDFLEQIIKGLFYLHSHEIAHYDMKSGNILLNDADEPTILKICDYGLSKNFSGSGIISTTTEYKGTKAFMAPEVAEAEANGSRDAEETIGFNRKSDIWSFGMIGLHLINGKLPTVRPKEVPSIMADFVNVTEQESRVMGLLKQLLIIDPNQRLDAAAALLFTKGGSITYDIISSPPGIDKMRLQSILIDQFLTCDEDPFPFITPTMKTVEVLGSLNSSLLWIGMACNGNDDVSLHGAIIVHGKNRQYHFYWHKRNSNPSEDHTSESVDVHSIIKSNEWLTTSAIDVANAVGHQYVCVLSEERAAYVVGTDDRYDAVVQEKYITLFKYSVPFLRYLRLNVLD